MQLLQNVEFHPDDIVLDIGCGAGSAARQISDIAPHTRLIALDVSEKMLTTARKNLDERRAHFVCNDACHLGFRSQSVNKIICYSTFPHIKNQIAAISEFHRVLNHGGQLLIFHNCCSRRLNTYHAKIDDIVAFDKLPKAEFLADVLRQNNFAHIKVIENPDIYCIEARKGVER